jgi:hypothetical protein
MRVEVGAERRHRKREMGTGMGGTAGYLAQAQEGQVAVGDALRLALQRLPRAHLRLPCAHHARRHWPVSAVQNESDCECGCVHTSACRAPPCTHLAKRQLRQLRRVMCEC